MSGLPVRYCERMVIGILLWYKIFVSVGNVVILVTLLTIISSVLISKSGEVRRTLPCAFISVCLVLSMLIVSVVTVFAVSVASCA